MNKKFKIVSTVALAGMLLTSSLGINRVNAADLNAEVEDNFTTNPVAVYRKLVEGKTVVPFVLANRNDILTVKDVVESDIFAGKVSTINGVAVSSLNMRVGTGAKVTTTDGTEYTIIVYGDVNGDGELSAGDTYLVERYASDLDDLNDVQREAADIGQNNGAVDAGDSYIMKRYKVDLETELISSLPEKEEVVEDSNYSITLNDGVAINNQNKTKNKISISLDETLDEDITLKMVASDNDNTTADKESFITILAHTDYYESKEGEYIDLSTLAEGNITINLYDEDEKIVATVQVVKNTTEPEVTNVVANRTSTRNATLSLEKMGASDITKIKYMYEALDGSTKPENVTELTKSADIQNNKLDGLTIATDLDTDVAYKVYFVVENQYGSQSGIKEAIIAKDNASVKQATKLAKVEVPDLTDLTDNKDANFTFVKDENDKDSHTYIATLYKDGAPISEQETGNEYVSFKTEIEKAGTGTYKVSVVVKGDTKGEKETNSEATVSEEVTVTSLKAVEGLTMEKNDEGKVILSWDNPNGKDDFKAYEIDLYKLDTEGEEEFVETIAPCANDKNEVDVSEKIENNKIYYARVRVIQNDNQMATVSSTEVTSNQFYKVEKPQVTSAKKGSTSIKFNVSPIEIPNKEVEYKIEVHTVNFSGDPTKPLYTKVDTKTVTIDENDQVTVDGLNPTTYYAFRLIATVEGNEVNSEYSDPISTLPVFNSVEKTDTLEEAEEAGSNKVTISGNDIVMNGVHYNTTTITELQPAKNVIAGLKAGDVVTMDDDATVVSLDLTGGASAQDNIRNFGSVFANSTVEITNNEYSKTITGDFKALTLKGTGAIYTVTGATVETPIVLTNGVEVAVEATKEATTKDCKVEAGATVKINKVEVTTSEDVNLEANAGKDLVVTANTVANDLTFVNSTAGSATITFEGEPDNTSEQKGTITIKTEGGSVEVKSLGVNVSAEMKVEVTNGTATITDPSLTGNKEVTVSAAEGEESTVFAVTEMKAPEVLKTNEKLSEIELKDYTDDEIRTTFGDKNDEMSQADVIAVREYINSFGVNGKGVKVSVGEDLASVTIVLTEAAQNLTIGNLK